MQPAMNRDRRASTRSKRVAPRMKVALFDKTRQQELEKARVSRLEGDEEPSEQHAYSDEEFTLPSVAGAGSDSDEVELKSGGSNKRKRAKLRRDGARSRTFEQLLSESHEENVPSDLPCYSRIAAGPPSQPTLYLCAVCGFLSKYTCTLCGVKYCGRKCFATHKDTRCLKFTV